MPERMPALVEVEAFLAATGPIMLINLPYRTDRRAEFAEQLDRLGLSYDHPDVHVFDAVRPGSADGFPTIGTRGCFLSHLGVLRHALAQGWDRVLICEDDLDFTDEGIGRLADLAAALRGQDWSILYGGYRETPTGAALPGGLVRLDPDLPVSCAHMYAVRGPAIADLVTYLEAMLTRPVGHPEGGLMHYDGALCWFRKAFPQHASLATVPEVGVQRASRTDIHALRWFDRWPVVRDLASLARRARQRSQRARGA